MPNSTHARTTELRDTAAEIISAARANDSRAMLQRRLVAITDCAKSTAQRHINAALGVTPAIGRSPNRPVQTISFRATKAELEAIRPAARAKINALLAESRAAKDDCG